MPFHTQKNSILALKENILKAVLITFLNCNYNELEQEQFTILK